jgi:tetratricopeptide (TPR) repeat protein
MSSDVDAMVQEAIQAYNAGDMDKAQALLMEATELNDEHEQAWMWLSLVVEDEEDKRICLENVLSINPNNQGARERLKELVTEDPSVQALLADDEDETDFEGVFESAFDEDVFDDEGSDDDQGFELFAEDEFEEDEEEEESALTSGPYSSSFLAGQLEDDEEEEDEPEPISPSESTPHPILSPMEETPAPAASRARGPSGSMRDDDYFRLIPAAIEATRLPGSDEQYPAWVVPSLVLLVVLNLLALVLLVLNA